MKKNFISKLLMATLVVVTMGVFSSCKDYDDDINANTALINQLQTQVKALEEARTSLEKQLGDANTAIKNAQADATKALSDIDQAKKDLSEAIAKGDQANAQEIQNLQNRVNSLETELKQYASDQAAAAVQAAVTKYQLEEVANLIQKVQALDEAMANRYTKEEIDAKLANYVKSEDFTKAVQDITKEISDLRTEMNNADKKLADDLQANADADKIVADKLNEIYSRAIKDGEIDKAIAAVASELSSFKEGINKILNEDEAKENAGFATLTALNAAKNQIAANETAIKALQDWTTNFDTNVLPTLATVEVLNQKVAELKGLIDKKADQTALDNAVNEINETIKTLATKAEVATQIEAAVNEIKELLTKDYVTNAALETALTKLSGEITVAYKAYTDAQFEAFRGELAGIIQTAITTNNTTLKQEIYGEVDSKIATALTNYVTNSDLATKLGQYTTTASLLEMLADYAKKTDVTTEINNFYNTKLADKMAEIETIKNQLASMDEAFVELAEELAALDDFDTSAGRQASSATSGITALKNLLTIMSEKIVNLHQYVEQSIQDVNDKLDVFVAFTNKNITSLVSVPDEWLYGLPKIDATVIAARPTYTFSKSGSNATYTETANRSSQLSGYAFELQANYWLNPSVANWKEYTYTMDEVAAKSYITRGNEDTQKAGIKTIDTDKDVSFKNGVLTVKFQFKNGENVNNAITKYDAAYLTDGTQTEGVWNEHELSQGNDPAYSVNARFAWTTTIALQAKRNNTDDENNAGLDNNRVVTSDYAIVAPTYIYNLLLGNNAYAAKGHGVEGNNEYHLRTVFNDVKTEDAAGTYSFELDLDDTTGLELNKYVDVHYNDCDVWTNEQAQKKGFEFVYTLLVNNDVWNLDGDKITIKEGKGVSANTGNAKAAIVRVELKADGKTYAYGYISVLMKNKQTELEIEIPEIVLNCDPTLTGTNGFTGTYSWANFMTAIKNALGKDVDWALADFVPVTATEAPAPNAGPYKKFANKTAATADTNTKGEIAHVGANLAWTFTLAEVNAAFYTNGKPNNTENYATIIKIMPNDNGLAQGVAPIVITVKIGKVVYPTGDFGDKSNRIQQMWFEEHSATIAKTKEDRFEIHANVETLGQNLAIEGVNTAAADDEFVFDISSTFVLNQFTITPDAGFTFGQDADVFFDASKYANKTNGWTMEHVYQGATGQEYVLWLNGALDLKLKASPKNGNTVNFNVYQTVVELEGAHNQIAIFQGYRDPENHFYARDLLNHAGHDKLAAGQTFTTHMIMHQIDYCLTIDERGAQTFDIRYLRPISAIANDTYTVYDAQNDGNKIWLADLVKFVDWRNHNFAASGNATYNGVSTGKSGMTYMNYYGITTIKADFDNAKTNINGGSLDNPSSWPLITDITSKMNFTPDEKAAAGLGSAVSDTRTAATFRLDNGYYNYENNAAGVGDFYIYLPISIVYDWGETQPEWILIHVVRTQGQDNQARQL